MLMLSIGLFLSLKTIATEARRTQRGLLNISPCSLRLSSKFNNYMGCQDPNKKNDFLKSWNYWMGSYLAESLYPAIMSK